MPSALGQLVTHARTAREMSLRELARRIGKSPSFVRMIEQHDPAPGVAEKTLRSIGDVLEISPDRLVTLVGKTPHDVVPATELEVAIYRRVKVLSSKEQETLLRDLKHRSRQRACCSATRTQAEAPGNES